MSTKICSKCHEEKPATLEYFHAQKNRDQGLTPSCKQCRNKNGRESSHIKINHTYEGFLQRVWGNMCDRCKRLKTYKGKLNITKEQFIEWGLETLPEFCRSLGVTLEDGLIGKGISIDKIDDSIGYKLGNLQWLTHTENNSKGNKGRFDKPVLQYSKQDEFIAEFPSVKEANIAVNRSPEAVGISAVINGRQKTAYGYKWKCKSK